MSEIPLAMRCPVKGEEWPSESFKAFLAPNSKAQTCENIALVCPAGHKFTLARAVQKGMFTADQAKKIVTAAEQSAKILECSSSFGEIQEKLEQSKKLNRLKKIGES